jgi:hypothetical protein
MQQCDQNLGKEKGLGRLAYRGRERGGAQRGMVQCVLLIGVELSAYMVTSGCARYSGATIALRRLLDLNGVGRLGQRLG